MYELDISLVKLVSIFLLISLENNQAVDTLKFLIRKFIETAVQSVELYRCRNSPVISPKGLTPQPEIVEVFFPCAPFP